MTYMMEDKQYMDSLAESIKKTATRLTMGVVKEQCKSCEPTIGYEQLFNAKKSYAFEKAELVDAVLYAFFSSEYAAKRLARICFDKDEDDVFFEEFDADFPLGMVKTQSGEVKTTSIVCFKFENLAMGKKNKVTGLPFKISEIRLVEDDL